MATGSAVKGLTQLAELFSDHMSYSKYCLYVCLSGLWTLTMDGTNRSRCIQRLVILLAQT